MRSRYKFGQEGVYFITSTIIEWLPVFTTEKYCKLIIDSFNYCRQEKNLKLHAYVILDNHFHAIVSGENVNRAIASLRQFTAKTILDELRKDYKEWLLNQLSFYKKKFKSESEYQVWQESVHPQILTTMEALGQKVNYIHYNPVRRGLVVLPEHWKYSSAANYVLKDHSVIEIDMIEA